MMTTSSPSHVALFGMPPHHGDPLAEERLVAAGRGCFPGIRMTVARVRGRDRADYLNRRLARGVLDMRPGETRRAALLGGDGRMQADLEILALEEEWLLFALPTLDGTELADLLARYVFSEDVEVEDLSDRLGLGCVMTWGDAAGVDGVRRAFASDLLAGAWLLLEPGTAMEEPALGFEALDRHRIRRGVPWWGWELDGQTIPLEAELFRAVSFDKGCYPGQEVLARMRNLGHPARCLVGLAGDAEGGARLLGPDGTEAGAVTSSCISLLEGRRFSLGMVKWAWREPGTRLGCGEGTVEVCALAGGVTGGVR